MQKRHFYTMEERRQMIKKYNESGQSMTSGCSENNIHYSTFTKWCKKYNVQTEFLELKKNKSKAPEKAEKIKETVLEILIEKDALKIRLPLKEGLKIVEDFLKGAVENV